MSTQRHTQIYRKFIQKNLKQETTQLSTDW